MPGTQQAPSGYISAPSPGGQVLNRSGEIEKNSGCEKQPDSQIHVKFGRPWEAHSTGLLPHGRVEGSTRKVSGGCVCVCAHPGRSPNILGQFYLAAFCSVSRSFSC